MSQTVKESSVRVFGEPSKGGDQYYTALGVNQVENWSVLKRKKERQPLFQSSPLSEQKSIATHVV